MHARRAQAPLISVVISTLVLTACGVGSPVTIADRPLSERVADRTTSTVTATADEADDAEVSSTPEAIAFSEALANGNFIRLHVNTNGVDTPLRSGPGAAYEQVTVLPDGAEVLATGDQTGEWVYAVYGDLEGWVSNRRIEIGEITSETAVITQAEREEAAVVYEVHGNPAGVNIRSQPNASGNLVSGASAGAEVVGTGQTQGGWIEITHNGVTGWSSGTYLRPIGTQ